MLCTLNPIFYWNVFLKFCVKLQARRPAEERGELAEAGAQADEQDFPEEKGIDKIDSNNSRWQ